MGRGRNQYVLPSSVATGIMTLTGTSFGRSHVAQANLKRNYDPHLEPSVDDAPEAVELQQALLGQAREMLRVILASERDRSRGKGKVRDPSTGKVRSNPLFSRPLGRVI